MDKVKIAKLCNEIEDIACDISQQTMNDIISAESRMIFDKAKEISAEISAPPKSNADRIRQMTDEELAEWITDGHDLCDLCQFSTCRPEFNCEQGVLQWLKQEVSEDAGKTD